jgi:hypothetical protein
MQATMNNPVGWMLESRHGNISSFISGQQLVAFLAKYCNRFSCSTLKEAAYFYGYTAGGWGCAHVIIAPAPYL